MSPGATQEKVLLFTLYSLPFAASQRLRVSLIRAFSAFLTRLVWRFTFLPKERQTSMKAIAIDELEELRELQSPQERAVYLSLSTVSPERLLALVEKNLLARNAQKTRADQKRRLLVLRGEATKPLIEERSGPALSSDQAAERLKISSETVRSRVRDGLLVGYTMPGAKARLRLPEWQFAGPASVHAWVPVIVRSYGSNGWALVDFLTAPRLGLVADKSFSGESLLQRLQAGEIDLVLEAARRANPA